MKQLLRLKTVVMAFAFLMLPVQADMVRIEGGIGAFVAEPGGTFDPDGGSEIDLKDDLGLDTENDPYFWVFLKHPIPIVPNVRLEYLELQHNPDGASSFKVQELDGILYYNFLDNLLWITLDLGLDLKYVTTDADDLDSETAALALLYGRVRLEPLDWLGLEALLKATNYGDNKGYDARLKADLTLSIVPVVQPALEVGYRIHKIQYEIGDVIDKAEYTGVYMGLMLRF
jgi:outer membrane protein